MRTICRGFSPLSPTTLSSFVTAFGGFGLIFSKIEATSSPWISVPLSLIGGLAVAAGVFVLFNKIFHATQSSSEGRVGQLVGHEATIITPIAAGGAGEIAYVQGGSRYTASARAEDSRAGAGCDAILCGESAAGMNTTRSSPSSSSAVRARMRCPWWMGSKVPPKNASFMCCAGECRRAPQRSERPVQPGLPGADREPAARSRRRVQAEKAARMRGIAREEKVAHLHRPQRRSACSPDDVRLALAKTREEM